MLLNDFFKIENIESGEKYIVDIEMNPKHKIYEGHFLDNPIAPGVCLTQMVKEVVEQIFNKKLIMVTGDNIKFTAVLNPEINKDVVMTVALKTKENGLLHADSSITAEGVSFFSFKGSFKESE